MAIYIENAKGFLSIGRKQIMQLTDISIEYTVAMDEISTFDSGLVKFFTPTWSSWTADASGLVDPGTTGYITGTGATTPTGATNQELILKMIKLKQPFTLNFKLDSGVIQSGTAYLSSQGIKAQDGKFLTGSLKFQGSGQLSDLTN